MKALITGISGQDGSYLVELLQSKNIEVFGTVRRHSQPETQTNRIDHLKVKLYYADITDFASLKNAIEDCKPDIIYNLAAQSHVQVSSSNPIYTLEADSKGVLNLLELCKDRNITLYQASSSEMFGNEIDPDGYQRESTKMVPVSPYGCAKLYAHSLCNHYRTAYDMNISCGILFNHESERRGINFVTGKVCKAVADIKSGKQKKLKLGNLESSRDWGYAPDYVEAIYLMSELNTNLVVATGESRTVEYLCKVAFESVGLNYADFVEVDPAYFRREELSFLKGDAKKIRELGWKPTTTFNEMIEKMVTYYL